MANPQLEEGFVPIAYDLYLAIACISLPATEKDVLSIIIYLTYGMGRSKAAITAQDIQILLTADRRIRLERVEAAIKRLTVKRLLYTSGTNGSLIGIQKDFEKWGSPPYDSESAGQTYRVLLRKKDSSNKTITSNRDILSIVMAYTIKGSDFTYGPSSWGVERKFANLLYRDALLLTGDPREAQLALRDYIDELKAAEFFAKVKMRFRFMHSRFRQWYRSIPAKDRATRENEATTGYRYKYSNKSKQWEKTNERISQPTT